MSVAARRIGEADYAPIYSGQSEDHYRPLCDGCDAPIVSGVELTEGARRGRRYKARLVALTSACIA